MPWKEDERHACDGLGNIKIETIPFVTTCEGEGASSSELYGTH